MGYIGNQSTKIVYTNLDRFKGVLADITALNAITGMSSGDMYKLLDSNNAYMYDGTAWVDMGDIEGPQGPKGIGISSIVRTAGDGSEGTTDTYTITYDDTSTSTFNVTNGTAGTINHIAKTGTVSTTDTYTAYADAAKTQPLGSFEVYNGVDGLSAYEVAANNGFVGTEAEWLTSLDGQDGIDGRAITSVTFTSTTDASGLPAQAGSTDTYTISYSDATTSTYNIYNGADVTNVSVIDDNQITLTNTWSASKIASDLDLKLSLSGGTMTGAITALRETSAAISTGDIDLATGNMFTKTISGATTLTISNALTSPNVNSFVLELTNGGAFAVNWFSGVKWAGGTAPTLTASGKDILSFYSIDGGTTWNVLGIQKDVK